MNHEHHHHKEEHTHMGSNHGSEHKHQKEEHDHGKHHDHSEHHAHMVEDFKKRFWVSIIVTIPILVLAPMIQELLGYEFRFKGDRYVQFIISSFIFFYGGWPFLKGLFKEIKDKRPGMMTLIAAAITVAYVYSSAVVFGLGGKIFFWELASLIVIMLLGHWVEMKSVMGASNSLKELAKLMPSTARKIKQDGSHVDVSVSELRNGDIILVRPGEKLPADGMVLKGESHINESMLTGESKPILKREKDKVIGGSINDKGALEIKVEKTGEESYLSKVISMVKEAQSVKSRTQNLADKAAGWLFYIALGSGILTFIVWLSIGQSLEFALERMVTVMIISCPHALGLAIPLVVAISTSVSAQNGLLIRNRTAFENARKLSAIIFDKTGTLTLGSFGVTRYKSEVNSYSDNELLRLVASLESSSEHPIAAGILKKAEEEGLQLKSVDNFQNITGKGIEGKVEGTEIKVVSPGALKAFKIDLQEDVLRSEDETVVFVLINDEYAGFIALADEIREDSAKAVEILKSKNIKVYMATGDNRKVAKAVSEKLGLNDFYAEVLPEDKQQIIKDLQAKGEFVAMTGDGVNDAPALAQADIGIAVGSGTDVAAETADIILVNSRPTDISNLIIFGSATYSKMMQNLWWAAGYNIVAVPLAAGLLSGIGILLSPAVGAILMSLSTVIVAINAQLLKRQMKKQYEDNNQ